MSQKTQRPHDALFKAAFETPDDAGALFRVLLPSEICAAIDWSTIEGVPGTFIDPALRDRHSDLLFRVQLCGAPALLYLLLEHQSTNSPKMPLRMVDYLVAVWKHREKHSGLPLPLIIPTLVSNARRGWTSARTLHELVVPAPESIPGLASLVPNYSMLVLDLYALDDDDLKNWALNAFPKLALLLLRGARDLDRLRDDFDRWRDLFLEVLRAPDGADAVSQVLHYIAHVTKAEHIEDFHATIFEKLPEAEEITMTIAEMLRQQGLEQGLERGLEQGRRLGLQSTLVQLLEQKFGPLPPPTLTFLDTATADDLTRYIGRVLAASSLDELLAD